MEISEEELAKIKLDAFRKGWKAHFNRNPGETLMQAEWWFEQHDNK